MEKMEEDYFKDERILNIFSYIKNKSVLDIGCYTKIIEDGPGPIPWVHGFLKKYSKHVKGIDIIKKNVEILKEKGFDVSCQNAESFRFKEKFDVVFAGDVIEHLSNPGLFLDRSRKHLKKDGWLIITTPNIFNMDYKIGGLIRFFNNDLAVNKEHTCFFSPTTIKELLGRHGFKVEKIIFVNFYQIDNLKRYLEKNFCKIFGNKFKYNMMIFARLNY